jgi:hypothetical protein
VAPRKELDDNWITELRLRLADNEDVAAVWWLAVIHEAEDPKVVVDELHFELVIPPEESASGETYKAMSPLLPRGAPRWSITPRSILDEVRNAGTRIA